MLLSRADQRSFTREHVDLSLIAEARETLLPLAGSAASLIETSAGDTALPSHALLLQMRTNLVHNVLHNLPEAGAVWGHGPSAYFTTRL